MAGELTIKEKQWEHCYPVLRYGIISSNQNVVSDDYLIPDIGPE